ncbi:MAG: dTMP kinase [Clostridiales bacterium]|jgi:dTMP kinase|nr:dTMP kinase [Clostridiales bacterium]
MEGLLITFEGPDGAGKTTQVYLVDEYLREKGYNTLVTREPGGTSISEEIRNILLNSVHSEMDALTEMYLYAAARAQHVKQVIKPALREGKIVLCDRFVDSSIAYQGFGRGLGMDVVETVNQYALQGTEPDLTLLFKMDIEKALNRGRARSGCLDRLEREKLEFHRRVYRGFCVLQEKYPWRIKEIDASKSLDDVFKQVLKQIEYLIYCKK